MQTHSHRAEEAEELARACHIEAEIAEVLGEAAGAHGLRQLEEHLAGEGAGLRYGANLVAKKARSGEGPALMLLALSERAAHVQARGMSDFARGWIRGAGRVSRAVFTTGLERA